MNLKTLIDEMANRADEILDNCTNPSEARATLLELLAAEHPELAETDHRKIANQVTTILDNESFFENDPGAAPWGTDNDEPENTPDDK